MGDEGTDADLRFGKAPSDELVVSPLDGDARDLEMVGERPRARKRFAWANDPERDEVLDLFHYLLGWRRGVRC